MNNPLHRAGAKIRAWRAAHDEMSAEDFGELVGRALKRDPFPKQSVYNWEARGKVARPPVQRALADMGICEANDWLMPAKEAA